ncbi:MAG: hypothetical protein CMI53_04475 [Parcubacteria group bacterium]|nr:hypothetical protein [Parcubacteria group bacterium]|tara:strand:+ start:152 stop:379 length:228 start_codon:yes stop_codon:yes gene_type:complete
MNTDICPDCGAEMKLAKVEAGKGSRDGFYQVVDFCPSCHPNMIDFQVDEPKGNSGCAIPITILVIIILVLWGVIF